MLQCALALRQLLNSLEPYYILNNLYISEYCVWIQKARCVHFVLFTCIVHSYFSLSLSLLFFLHSARQIQNIADELDEVHALGLTGKKNKILTLLLSMIGKGRQMQCWLGPGKVGGSSQAGPTRRDSKTKYIHRKWKRQQCFY